MGRFFPFFKHYPGTNLHEIDLDYVLRESDAAYQAAEELQTWADEHEANYEELKHVVDSLVNHLVDVIVPWDSSIEYPIYSIVEYQGTNYIAVQDVPVGAMITNTEYWQPANTVIEQINAIGATVVELKESLPYVTPEQYGAIGDGVADDTSSIQEAIDSGAALVIFQPKTYKCGTININRSNIVIDFNGANIECADGTFISASAPFDTVLYTGALTENNNAPSIAEYSGLVSIESSELVMPGRDYYYGGMVCQASNGELETALPYALASCTISAQSAPIHNVVLKNLGGITAPVSTVKPLFMFDGCAYVLLENMTINTSQQDGVLFTACNHVTVRQCSIRMEHTATSVYGIMFADGTTFGVVDDSDIYSNVWHCICTGGHRTNMHTTVENSSLAVSPAATNVNAYLDHGNTIDTMLRNCVISQSATISDGSVLDCRFNHLEGNSQHIRISLQTWLGSYYHSRFKVENCRTSYARIQLLLTMDGQNIQGTGIAVETLSIDADKIYTAERVEFTVGSSTVYSAVTSFKIDTITLNDINGLMPVLCQYAVRSFINRCRLIAWWSAIAAYTAVFTEKTNVHLTDSIVDVNPGNSPVDVLQIVNCNFIRTRENFICIC